MIISSFCFSLKVLFYLSIKEWTRVHTLNHNNRVLKVLVKNIEEKKINYQRDTMKYLWVYFFFPLIPKSNTTKKNNTYVVNVKVIFFYFFFFLFRYKCQNPPRIFEEDLVIYIILDSYSNENSYWICLDVRRVRETRAEVTK